MAAQLPAQITPELLQKGMQALQSGAIDPQTAAQNFHKFSPYLMKAQGPANAQGQGPAPVPAMGPQNAQANQAQVMAEAPAPGSQPAGAVVPAQNPMTFPMPDLKALTPIAPRSGLGEKESETGTVNRQTKDVQGQVLGEDPYNLATGRLSDNPAYKSLMGGQSKIQDMLDMEANRQAPTNLRGLAAMVDAWKGGSLLSGMPAAQTPQDKAKLLLDYEQKLQQDKKGILDSFSNNIKAQKAGAFSDLVNQTLVQNAQKTASDPFANGKQFATANMFNKYAQSQLQKNEDAATSLSEVAGEVAEGNPLSDKRISVLRAKLDAGGRPNISEVQMEGGDASLLARVSQHASTLLSGSMTDHNRQLFMQDIQTIAQLKQKERDMYISKLKDQGKTQYGQTDEQLASAFPSNFSARFDYPIQTAKHTTAKIKAGNPQTAPKSSGIQSIDDYFNQKGGQ